MSTYKINIPPVPVKKSLVQIAFEFEHLMDQINNPEGEITLELESLIGISSEELSNKLDAYGYLMDRLESEQEQYKKKADAYYSKATRCKDTAEKIKENIKAVMVQMEAKKLSGDDYTFTISPAKPKVLVIDENQIPTSYFRQEIVSKLSKDAVREAIEKGETVSGATLEQSYTLRKGIK